MADPARELQPVLTVTGCSKRYPSVVALDDVSLDVGAGEVRGLVGQNGAGKSTLIKVIAGAVPPDDGSVAVHGSVLRPGVVSHRAAGISAIYQDPQTVPQLSAAENVFLGELPRRRGGVLRPREMYAGFAALCDELKVEIDPRALASELSLGDRQLVEIMRAYRAARSVLILDEPTSALPEHERERLFEVMRTVSASGIGTIFISHDLDEVLEVCDTITVLRDGRHVRTDPAADLHVDDLVEAMTGDLLSDDVSRTAATGGEVLLDVVEVSTSAGVESVSLQVRAGEVVGLAGLLGSGRSETLRAVAGADALTGGVVRVDGRPVRSGSIPAAKRDGVHLVPEDRKTLGLIADQTVTENVSLGKFDGWRWWHWVSTRREAARQAPLLEQVDLTRGRAHTPVRTLSGGNQQKVLLSRALQHEPLVVLLDEPTAGIDVRAKAQIHRLVHDQAARGAAVLVVLSDLGELLQLTDRVYVVRAGRTVAEYPSHAVTENDVLHQAFATRGEPAR
jgi:rhamnose transport system ATP-binding protein